MVDIPSIDTIIAGISPDVYSTRDVDIGSINLSGFKKALKEDFWQALRDMGDKYNLKPTNAEQHKIIYDSSSETLEPIYFWVLDLTSSFFGGKVEKLVDNFVSSPGSGHFSELMGKATHMQEQAMKILATVNTVIKSIINIIYDLKEFEIRLNHYKQAESKDKDEAEAGLLSLKQIWMDNVDIKRGQGSINALAAGNLQFATIRDAFMMAKSDDEVEKMDLNDRVKRILKPRLQEFFKWRELSGKELMKRYELERTYLKSQVDSLKLYSRWAKPYLKASLQLEQKEAGRKPDIVTAFNTIRFELTILGKNKFDFFDAVANKKLPESFRNIKLKRDYYSCILIDFYFRGIPQKVGQHYVFGGRAEVTFRAYSLNKEELDMLNEKLEESDLNDALKLVSGMTEDSLKEMQEDVNYFLKAEEERKEEKEEEVNPFAALLGFAKKKEKKEKEKIKEVKKDNYIESLVRKLAEDTAKDRCFSLFDIYKKAHGMETPVSQEF